VLLGFLSQDAIGARPALARISTALLAFVLAGMLPLHGQDQPPGVDAAGIATDRPAVTNSSVVVPVGSLQAENGFLDTSSQRQSVLDRPESLVRFGIAKRTELRFTVPDYFHNLTTGYGGSSGFGDVAIGVKQQLGPAHGFDISVIAFLSLPTGANGVSSGGCDPGLQVPWSRALSANWTAAGMFSVYWPTQGRMRNVTGESTFLLDRQLTKPWDAFVRGGLSGSWRAAALATFWNSSKDHQVATD
jgi:outer membrane putative beta-barrel porin/alpha-amylase